MPKIILIAYLSWTIFDVNAMRKWIFLSLFVLITHFIDILVKAHASAIGRIISRTLKGKVRM